MQPSDFLNALQRLFTQRFDLFVSLFIFLIAVSAGVLVARYIRRVLVGVDVPGAVEGTPFERTARRIGTSTVGLLSNLSGLFVLVVGGILALRLVGFIPPDILTTRITSFLREAFIAIIILIVGIITGDKSELYVRERLRGIKVPEMNILPQLVKYSIFYVAVLVALDQLGVAATALLILLAAYGFGLFFIGGLAFKDLLSSAAAGIYLLLTEPYVIGDSIEIDGNRGVVQEVDTFVTRIENDEKEYIIPNREVFRNGVVRVRN